MRFRPPVTLQSDAQSQRNFAALASYLSDVFGPGRGHALPQSDSLPEAGEGYRGTLYLLRGGHDGVYVCVKAADDSFDWAQII